MSERILFRNISHRFGRLEILRAASLGLGAGKATMLAGPNGSGKTTLMRIMAGLLPPRDGRIVIGDRILTWRQARRQLLARTVYLHQEPYMFDASVTQNLAFPLRARRLPDRRGRTLEALGKARLEDKADQPAKSLSGGERRRLAIARAWLTGVDFMLLDEPTANLDATARDEALTLMQQLRDSGIGLVIASHTPEDVSGVIDDVVSLEDQSVAARGTLNRDAQTPYRP